jgi:predicted phosphodiesterase
MRILVISDIHANLVALEAVLASAPDYEAVWCLGDIVGYGPSPNECVEKVGQLPNLICLLGNHDAATIGKLPLDSFNFEARNSIEWVKEQLNPEANAFLDALPINASWKDFSLVHASPRRPLLEYLLDTHTAAANFSHFDSDYCLIGHTHIPSIFTLDETNKTVRLTTPHAEETHNLQPRSFLNPGSVGQPRDHDPRAAFAILDTDAGSWQTYRADYDIHAVQRLMLAADLPDRNITRLESGW